MKKIPIQDLAEFKGQMMDTIEDFCDKVGITIANTEKLDESCSVNIYGSDYDRIGAPVDQFVKGEIHKEEIAVRMIREFLNILAERGVFVTLYNNIEDTVANWTEEGVHEMD